MKQSMSVEVVAGNVVTKKQAQNLIESLGFTGFDRTGVKFEALCYTVLLVLHLLRHQSFFCLDAFWWVVNDY